MQMIAPETDEKEDERLRVPSKTWVLATRDGTGRPRNGLGGTAQYGMISSQRESDLAP